MIRIDDKTNGLYRCEIAEVLAHAISKLGVSDADVTVYVNTRVLDNLSNADTELQALTYEAAPGKFVLFLRERLSLGTQLVLCHEAVHLAQYISGRLKYNHKTGVCTWNGQSYAADYPYRSRPWEIEAFAKQGKLLKDYRKTKKRCIL